MPKHPEDDWTRPMPRPRGGGREGGHAGDPDRTERMPRPRPEPRYDDRYDEPRYEDQRYEDHRYEDGYDDRDDQRRAPAARPPRRGGPPPRRRRPRYGIRRALALLAFLLVAYLVTMIVVVAMVWGSINRVDAEPDVADRPGTAPGETYLLVGTDSREELSDEQRSDFGTGSVEGHRADTVMLLHVPGVGDPTLVSLPRDSYVEIRDHGWAKLNSAHSIGGPALLVDTVEQATGMPIDGYLEIGFGGFVTVVDEVGGVEMCLDAPIEDQRAHIDLPAGCQDLSGADALGYVRMRYSDQRGDLGRVERQREFLGALVEKMATPSTVLNPWRLHQVGTATGGAIALGEDTSLISAGRMALAMRTIAGGGGASVTVPIAEPNYSTNVGSTVLWDEEGAAQLFTALRHGQDITVEP